MELIAGCQVALEPTRISAVAECKKETYLGDTELQVFLRCLGDAPTCDRTRPLLRSDRDAWLRDRRAVGRCEVKRTRSGFLLASCLALTACFSGGSDELPPPPPPVYTGPTRANSTRPKECQVAMQLITTCKVALEPTRISAVAECTSPAYLGRHRAPGVPPLSRRSAELRAAPAVLGSDLGRWFRPRPRPRRLPTRRPCPTRHHRARRPAAGDRRGSASRRADAAARSVRARLRPRGCRPALRGASHRAALGRETDPACSGRRSLRHG